MYTIQTFCLYLYMCSWQTYKQSNLLRWIVNFTILYRFDLVSGLSNVFILPQYQCDRGINAMSMFGIDFIKTINAAQIFCCGTVENVT